ncbi:MAG: NAD-dependent epimerase/dehydratase family protein [Candidatus Hydrogenedentes bacterium]|nr:NAD-dependent epimerase/dehydratase family protein [Candidatus Hydrogenedentota bacterium]
MTRVAITGASGHVGANLVRLLIERGYDVCAVVHGDSRGVEGLACRQVSGSVLDPLSLCEAFKSAEYVFHLAAIITLTRDRSGMVWRTNVEGTKNVVDACVACGVRKLIQCSSIHAFSAYPLEELITESRALATEPNLPDYDRSKVGGELEALKGIERGLEVVIINPTAVVGPNDFKPSRMGKFLLEVKAGKMPAVVEGGFNWVDARDVSLGAEAAARLGKSGGRYLLAGTQKSLLDLSRIACEITGTTPPRFASPIWMAHMALPFGALVSAITGKEQKFTSDSLRAVTHHQKISHEKASRELGYAARPLQETISDTYKWFVDAGYA